jgi:Ca2+/Na+ antiporter
VILQHDTGGQSMAFFLFLVVNAALFVRPTDFVPALQQVSLYEYSITLCLLVSIPDVLRYLTQRPLDHQPITCCVLALLAVIITSEMSRLDFDLTIAKGVLFFKVAVYYLLFVSLVNTPGRLRVFLAWLVLCCAVLTAVTVLHYHELIDLPQLQDLKLITNEHDVQTGSDRQVTRLQATGIFHDPNELCVLLAALVPLVLYCLESSSWLGRAVWLGPLGLFLYAIALTHSRGGFLAFLAGLTAFTWIRYSWRKTVVLGGLGLPLLLLLFAGRQTDISANVTTGQSRIQLWSDWMMVFRENPLLGQGMSRNPLEPEKEKARGEETKHLAHNSYVQGFADLGVVGGMLFLGAFYLAWRSVTQFRAEHTRILDSDQRRLQPYLAGTLAAFAVGLLSLSFCYDLPTYSILGLAAVFPAMTRHEPALPELCIDSRLVGRLAVLSVGFLAVTYVFVRVFVRWA